MELPMYFIVALLYGLYLSKETQGELRLVDGKTSHDGIVQTFFNGTWRTLWVEGRNSSPCYWSLRNSFVVCRALNYSKAVSPDCTSFEPTHRPAYPYLVYCRGSEQSIDECGKSRYLDYDNLSNMKAVMVDCRNLTRDEKAIKIRLVGENKPYYGIVEIHFQGMWRRVIEIFTFWNVKSANVVCRMLGYKSAVSALYYPYVKNSPVNNGSLLDEPCCSGNEKSIAECAYASWKDNTTYKDYYAGAFCYEGESSSQPVELRLTGGRTPNTGQVELRYHGVWGTICDFKLSDSTNDVICRILGYSGENKDQRYVYYKNRPKLDIVWLYKVKCNGSEDSILKCNYPEIGDAMYVCNHNNALGVSCKLAPPPHFTLSGCGPQLFVDRNAVDYNDTIESYEIFVFISKDYLLMSFHAPSTFSSIMLGSGNTVLHGYKPFKNGSKLWIALRTIFKHKSGGAAYSEYSSKVPFTVTFCSTNASKGTDVVHTNPAVLPTNTEVVLPHSSSEGTRDGTVLGILVAFVFLANS